ncbi:hypothetical protein LI90_3456 [Carbonactinospora thermoautotrophica]|uniref:Uncharacterized protein n=1 Tax=Carbonactinospora thermoautotrophica TaxID=1469144 RepID=A0A132MX42_9ACTN|nr:hypothetical protein LI90_3456 [Carbonactinospora thermoautotrophica]
MAGHGGLRPVHLKEQRYRIDMSGWKSTTGRAEIAGRTRRELSLLAGAGGWTPPSG